MSQPTPPGSAWKDPLQPPNLFYRGSSMKGTFQPGDRLVIEKLPSDRIKRGDVVIFRRGPQRTEGFIVHRVVGITADGLLTRGDNRPDRDKDPVPETSILGRVIGYDRRGGIRRAWNGKAGRLWAALLHARRRPIQWFKFLCRRPYVALRRTGLVARLWQPEIEAARFETPEGPLVKYLHKGRTVAVHWRSKGHWLVKRPYDFLFQFEKTPR